MSSSVIPLSSGSLALAPARLIFGVDATASRSETWEIACELQAGMFREAGAAGDLSLLLIYYGGTHCRESRWHTSGEKLARLMHTVKCESGKTQIQRVLKRALCEHAHAPIQAITFIGDAQEESLDVLAALADELGAAGVPLHMYQEGHDPAVTKAYRLLALKTGGRYSSFDVAVPETIARLSAQLNEVARVSVNRAAAIGTSRR